MLRRYYMTSVAGFAVWTYAVAPGVAAWATIMSGNMLKGASSGMPGAGDGYFILPLLIVGFYVFTIPIIVAYVAVLYLLQRRDWLNLLTAPLAALLGIAAGLAVMYHGNPMLFLENGSMGINMLVGGLFGLLVAWLVCRWRGTVMPVHRFNPDYFTDLDP